MLLPPPTTCKRAKRAFATSPVTDATKNLSSFAISSVTNRVVSMIYPIYAHHHCFFEFCVTHRPSWHQRTPFLAPTTYNRAKLPALLDHFEFCVTTTQRVTNRRFSNNLRPTSERSDGPSSTISKFASPHYPARRQPAAFPTTYDLQASERAALLYHFEICLTHYPSVSPTDAFPTTYDLQANEATVLRPSLDTLVQSFAPGGTLC